MTLGFALTTALGLLALAAITLQLDDQARHREADDDLTTRIGSLGRTVDIQEDGSLDLTRFERAVETDPPERWAVLSDGVLLVAGPDEGSVPADRGLARIVDATRGRLTPRTFTADDDRGAEVQWSAVAVSPGPGLDPAPGSVVLVGERLPGGRAHLELQRGLAAAVAVLTLLTAATGHLLSGRAMRPAVARLDQQEQFLTEAAHELRTPIATLRLLLESDRPDAEDRAGERRQVARLERLLESLLLRARADANGTAPPLGPLRLDQLVARAVEELAPPEAGLSLAPVVVQGSPQVLGLAVRNLVENAERHGGGRIDVTVRDGALVVADHGPGIPEGRRAAVLRRGVSGDGGTGSGLALVAWAAEVHRAALALEDTAGGGLTVRIAFPTSSPPHGGRRSLEP